MINTVDENVTPGISVQAPAPAVSSVKVVAAQIKSDGYVYVTVQVAGYKICGHRSILAFALSVQH